MNYAHCARFHCIALDHHTYLQPHNYRIKNKSNRNSQPPICSRTAIKAFSQKSNNFMTRSRTFKKQLCPLDSTLEEIIWHDENLNGFIFLSLNSIPSSYILFTSIYRLFDQYSTFSLAFFCFIFPRVELRTRFYTMGILLFCEEIQTSFLYFVRYWFHCLGTYTAGISIFFIQF